MNNIDQTRLARLRPEKLDDIAVKEQISLVNFFLLIHFYIIYCINYLDTTNM